MRLIDADALLKGKDEHQIISTHLIWNAPTVDAVQVVRCADCKYLSRTTLGMEYACWHGAYSVWGETGEHKDHRVCTRIDDPDHFCAYGERREE